MTEKLAQAILASKFGFQSQAMLTNYTPAQEWGRSPWWECDLLRISKSMLAHEFEIKASLQDFRADFSKRSRRGQKHTLLALRKGWPNRFSFVLPQGLVPANEVPAHAGLIEIQVDRGGNWGWAQVVRQAPLLHDRKVEEAEVQHMMRNAMYRYLQDLRRRAQEAA